MEFSFLYAVCRAGSEGLLKSEVAQHHGDRLAPAFMRPQLITWKARAPLPPDFSPGLSFSRNWGFSLGLVAESGLVARRWNEAMSQSGGFPARWDVYPRQVPDEAISPEVWQEMDQIWSQLPPVGDSPWIGEVIAGGAGEPLLLGARPLVGDGPVSPGGLARVTLPPESPSRAWLKVEQALAWSGWNEESFWLGKSALELGSSPGGISLALVRRGLQVEAVDPAPMDPSVLAETGPGGAKARHRQQPVGSLARETWTRPVDLLVSDMNLAPPAVIRYIERLQPAVRARRWIITLKLNDAAVVSRLPDFRERLGRIAPQPLRVVQLPSNRQEVTVIAG
jgi:23S rRNA (cytidine2498-2'-O)-methyltransferase